MKYSLIPTVLYAATAAALPQGLGQISRSVIFDSQATAIAVPRNAEAQKFELGPVSRTVIQDSAQPTVLHVPRNAEAQRFHLGPVSRTVIYDSAQPTVLHVPRNAEAQKFELGPVSRTVIHDSPQPTVLHVPRNDEAPVEKRQSMGGSCTSNASCLPGFYCAAFPGGLTVCLPNSIEATAVQPPTTASRTSIDDTPVTETGGIEPTNVAIADRRRQTLAGQRCGGIGWSGPPNCPKGTRCRFVNRWFAQCE